MSLFDINTYYCVIQQTNIKNLLFKNSIIHCNNDTTSSYMISFYLQQKCELLSENSSVSFFSFSLTSTFGKSD